MTTQHREREDKYTAEEGVGLPELDDLVGDGRVETGQVVLTNRYFDTAGADLRRAGLTLRRRSGGADAGWQLKVPAGAARTEVASRSSSRTPPQALLDAVLGVTRGRPLVPVAELTTERGLTRLLDASGALRAEIADDRVRSTTLGEEARLDAWREIEVELGPAGDETLLQAVGQRLREAGARPSPHASKVGRALGLPPSRDPEPGELVTVADVVSAYVGTQCAEIVTGDLALRLGTPQVHRTRVAIRRLRSTLRVFASLLDPEPTARLEVELTWFAGLLGEVRDREVLLDRLLGRLAELPPELVLGPVAADLQTTLGGERSEHLATLTAQLPAPRQLELLEALARWQTEPPFLEGAAAPAKQARTFVDGAVTKMQRRLRKALVAGPDQEERLHGARKAAKRARYAAELLAPVWPKAEAVVSEAKELQTRLGEHQDSVVAGAFLRRAGAAAGTRGGHNGFTYGLLLGLEWQRAAAVRAGLGAAG